MLPCEVLRVAENASRDAHTAARDLIAELTRLYGDYEILKSGAGGQEEYFWVRQDVAVSLLDPYSDEPYQVICCYYIPLWMDSWDKEYGD